MQFRTELKAKAFFAIVFLLALLPGVATVVSAQAPTSSNNDDNRPDLVPILHDPMSAEIVVKNIGNGTANPSKLTLDCVKAGASAQMHSCPNLPLSAAAIYFDPAFPNNATIKVPALSPGEIFSHRLSFWDTSSWPKGRYKFTVRVDASHELKESNDQNNIAISELVIR